MEGKYSKHSRKKLTKLGEKEGRRRGRRRGGGRGGGKKKERKNKGEKEKEKDCLVRENLLREMKDKDNSKSTRK